MSKIVAKPPIIRPVVSPVFGLFILGLFIFSGIAFFFSYTNNISGTPDFFVEWTATRVSLEGGNPYSRETTELIQLGSKGRLVGPDEDQLAYATPYYRIFFSIPIAYLPYSVASAIWLGFMFALYLGAVHLVAKAVNYQTRSPLEGATFFLVLIFNFPAFSSLMLGQSALLSAAFLGWAYYCIKGEATLLAGVFTALATVKPQCAVGVVLFLGLYALWRLDWKFIVGFGGTLLLLVVPSFLMFPAWLSEFLQGVGRYGSYKKSLTGPGFAFEWLGGFSVVPVVLTTLGLLAVGGLAVWRAVIRPKLDNGAVASIHFEGAFSLMLVLTLLLPPQTNISNAAILFIPLLQILARCKSSLRFYSIALGSLVFSWLLYFLLYNNWYGGLIVLPPTIIGLLIYFFYANRKTI
jgi:hypothetical protein